MELVFEHRNYLPSMLFFVPAAALVMKGLATFSNRIMRVFILLSLCLILIAFGYSSFVRNAVWHDEKSLWEDVLVKYPHSFRAHTNLGRHLVLQGHDERAAHEFLQALESSETHRRVEKAIALYNLGYIAHRRGDHQTALHFYTRALEKDLCCPRANNNLAVLLLETGDGGTNDSEALDHLNKALECNHEEEIESAYANKRALLIKMGKANPLGTGPSIHQRLPLK
jgi:tetratricopeptide (TPR) repeat protein